MKLIIIEKPSTAQAVAAILGAKRRGDGYKEIKDTPTAKSNLDLLLRRTDAERQNENEGPQI